MYSNSILYENIRVKHELFLKQLIVFTAIIVTTIYHNGTTIQNKMRFCRVLTYMANFSQ